MNKLHLFFALSIGLFFCSCSDVENEVWVNEDGSGKMTMSYDMSPMLAMASMADGIDDDGGTKQSGEDEIEKSKNSDEDIMSILEGLKDPTSMRDMDTSFYFFDVMPDSVKQKTKNPDLFKKVKLSIETNKKESKGIMGLEFVYDNQDDLEKIFQEMNLLTENPEAGNSESKGFKEIIRTYEVDLKKGLVTFPEQKFEGELGDSMQGSEMDLETMDEESLAMMKMMLGEAGLSFKVHLPGKVISCDDPSATIDGNVVSFKDDFFSLMQERTLKARVIMFEP